MNTHPQSATANNTREGGRRPDDAQTNRQAQHLGGCYGIYDLQADPHELTNLAGVDALRDVADALRQRLIARMVAAGEPEPVIEPAAPRHGGQRAISIDQVRQRYNEQRM